LLKATRVCSWSAQRRSQGSTALVRPAHIHTCTCAQTKDTHTTHTQPHTTLT
jgi:hypothetical protein